MAVRYTTGLRITRSLKVGVMTDCVSHVAVHHVVTVGAALCSLEVFSLLFITRGLSFTDCVVNAGTGAYRLSDGIVSMSSA